MMPEQESRPKWGDYATPMQALSAEFGCMAPDADGFSCGTDDYKGSEGLCAFCGAFRYMGRLEGAARVFDRFLRTMAQRGHTLIEIAVVQQFADEFRRIKENPDA